MSVYGTSIDLQPFGQWKDIRLGETKKMDYCRLRQVCGETNIAFGSLHQSLPQPSDVMRTDAWITGSGFDNSPFHHGELR